MACCIHFRVKIVLSSYMWEKQKNKTKENKTIQIKQGQTNKQTNKKALERNKKKIRPTDPNFYPLLRQTSIFSRS